MIVTRYFEGDKDMEVGLRQLTVYENAFGIMVATCNRLTRFARSNS